VFLTKSLKKQARVFLLKLNGVREGCVVL